ncbi:hypothetical protein [Rhizobium ruizarguesonis]|uniref:hypothetical protein n=1 Tax=Rhizobium ruizarguesonis TaxID=2081791 RepID=UPI00103658B1|nr:hypothetical protein [Rhizobium ruizarguesonis]NEI81399.1 hypothetical protein [Rhizobium ruizarguesonis]NEK06925.1 hypothetical protein [Rhizobium ruizarguesonis]TBD39627.1 hypothetical protein ELH18_20115 [Rhizobium ruizarguesonis]
MSYIIAFVAYRDGEEVYPINCWRADIKAGDAVVVRQETKDGALKWARVVRVEFLNWKCKNYVECLASEATFDSLGIRLPVPTPTVFGACRPAFAWDHLKATGWSRHLPVSRNYRGGFSRANRSEVANIFFRSNGVDIQLIEGSHNPALTPDGRLSFSFSVSPRIVRHALSHSGINLFELVIEFADAFRTDCGPYDRFMKAVGRSDKSTEELRRKTQEGRSDGLWEALGGVGGESVYLGDGLYLGPGDRWRGD